MLQLALNSLRWQFVITTIYQFLECTFESPVLCLTFIFNARQFNSLAWKRQVSAFLVLASSFRPLTKSQIGHFTPSFIFIRSTALIFNFIKRSFLITALGYLTTPLELFFPHLNL